MFEAHQIDPVPQDHTRSKAQDNEQVSGEHRVTRNWGLTRVEVESPQVIEELTVNLATENEEFRPDHCRRVPITPYRTRTGRNFGPFFDSYGKG